MMNMAGTPSLNFQCFVLCRQTNIPLHAPMLPPIAASISKVASGILHNPFLAFSLSMPYTMNVQALTTKR